MALMKRNRENDQFPARAFRSAMDRVFEDFFNEDGLSLAGMSTDWFPRIDVLEEDDKIMVRADVPGINEKDLEVEVKDNILSIRGSRDEKEESDKGHYHKMERRYGAFSRQLQLPHGTDAEKIEAKYEKGVLNLSIPKAESSIPKKISVKSS